MMHSRDVLYFSDELSNAESDLEIIISHLKNGLISIEKFYEDRDKILIKTSMLLIESMNMSYVSGIEGTPITTLRPIVLGHLNSLKNRQSNEAIKARQALIDFDDMTMNKARPLIVTLRNIFSFWSK